MTQPPGLDDIRAAIANSGPQPHLLVDLAYALYASGMPIDARLTLAEAMRRDQSLIGTCLSHGDPALRHLAFLALAQFHPRVAQVSRPSSFLGAAGPDLAPETEAAISARLESAAQAFAQGLGPRPSFQSYDLPPDDAPKPAGLKVALVFCGDGQGDFSRNDLFWHLATSAKASGIEIQGFDAAGLLYRRPGAQAYGAQVLFDALSTALGAYSPDLVLIDANFTPDQGTLGESHLRQWRDRTFRLIFVVGDTDETSAVPVDFWAEHGDLVVVFNRSSLTAGCARQERLFHWPGLPVVPPEVPPHKDLEMIFIGRLYRGREVIAHYLRHYGLAPVILGRDLNDPVPIPMDAYLGSLGRARMTFNSGMLSGNRGIVALRVLEALVSRTLLLDEVQDPSPAFLVPFVHYVPIEGAPDAVIYAQYFRKHPDAAEGIAEAGFVWMAQHLPPDRFWRGVLAKLQANSNSAGLGAA
jgi:hypothetical protein